MQIGMVRHAAVDDSDRGVRQEAVVVATGVSRLEREIRINSRIGEFEGAVEWPVRGDVFHIRVVRQRRQSSAGDCVGDPIDHTQILSLHTAMLLYGVLLALTGRSL